MVGWEEGPGVEPLSGTSCHSGKGSHSIFDSQVVACANGTITIEKGSWHHKLFLPVHKFQHLSQTGEESLGLGRQTETKKTTRLADK